MRSVSVTCGCRVCSTRETLLVRRGSRWHVAHPSMGRDCARVTGMGSKVAWWRAGGAHRSGSVGFPPHTHTESGPLFSIAPLSKTTVEKVTLNSYCYFCLIMSITNSLRLNWINVPHSAFLYRSSRCDDNYCICPLMIFTVEWDQNDSFLPRVGCCAEKQSRLLEIRQERNIWMG